MSVPTTQEMLDNVRIAINSLVAGGAVQSYSIGGKNIQRMRLGELQDLEKNLERKLMSSKPNTTYATFKNPA